MQPDFKLVLRCMKNMKSLLNVWVITQVNGINFFLDLYLQNHLDSISGEFNFENLYYFSKNTQRSGKG